ncbi:MAG: HAD family hydrolase [Prevotella sp.]|nr:HAD family hydrolase [Prevotella sp.]
MYKLYILDFDGTVGDTNKLITQTMQATLREAGLPTRSAEACRKTIGLPLADCFRALMPLTDAQAEQCTTIYRRIFAESHKPGVVPVFPGVIEAIRQWHDHGAIITLASSRGHESLAAFVREMRLEPYISYVLGAEDVERAKPDPCPVLKTLDHFGIAPEETLVIGDMHYDILMGKGAGCRTCGVTYGNGTVEELTEAGADLLTDSLLQVG